MQDTASPINDLQYGIVVPQGVVLQVTKAAYATVRGLETGRAQRGREGAPLVRLPSPTQTDGHSAPRNQKLNCLPTSLLLAALVLFGLRRQHRQHDLRIPGAARLGAASASPGATLTCL